MFGRKGSKPSPSWKRVEDDFVTGACAWRLFGYLCRDGGGGWTAFNEDAQAVATDADLQAAQEALWAWHQQVHAQCQRYTA